MISQFEVMKSQFEVMRSQIEVMKSQIEVMRSQFNKVTDKKKPLINPPCGGKKIQKQRHSLVKYTIVIMK